MTRPRRPPPEPAERTETVRKALMEALRRGVWTARDLAREIGIRERDIGPHLEHLSRSVAHQAEQLQIEPASCVACGFVFEDRRRPGRPSRCPRCKSERLRPARYRLT